MKVSNKIMVVTGAGSGMGRQLTLLLVKRGAQVAMADVNLKGMRETATIAGEANVSVHEVNVADRSAIERLPQQVIEQHGAVDGLINNAGIIQPFITVNELGYETLERIMNINFYGTLYMTKAFLPHLLLRP